MFEMLFDQIDQILTVKINFAGVVMLNKLHSHVFQNTSLSDSKGTV